MTVSLRSVFTISAVTPVCVDARAQSNPSPTSNQQPASTTGSNESSRPATTTFYGDTGLWYVPTAEILPHGQFSVSGYRRGTNYIQGYTNVADFAGTFGVGISDRVELFGSFLFDTRIDRDVRPLFLSDPTFGGFVSRYPLVNTPWSAGSSSSKTARSQGARSQP